MNTSLLSPIESTSFVRLGFVLILMSGFSSCGYHIKSEQYSAAATVTPHYSSINSQIIQVQCLPCHAQNGGAPDFTTYEGLMRRVKTGNPNSSSLYNEVSSGDMPVDRPQLSDDDIIAIYQWIQNGAPND